MSHKKCKKLPYTDEQLSRILSAHEGEQLFCGGSDWRYNNIACVNQAAFLESSNVIAVVRYTKIALGFDKWYERTFSVERLLNKLREWHNA